MSTSGHRQSGSVSQNHKAQLANAYNELGKELSSQKIRVVGNYTLGKVIGEGTYGKVRLGTHRLTGTRVAIKQIPKAMSATLTREIHHHRQLHHPHVTQLFEVIATENNIWLVTELCSGGELFDYLAEKGRLSEEETRVFFGQLCLAVAYVHEKGIVHRDLKLENVLLDERCRVKLGDFGFTREFERGVFLETFCGTTGYASPEMLMLQKYLGPEVDVWSLGVILYTLLTGTLPFDDDDEILMRAKVIKGEFEDPEWLSDDARDLLKNILQSEASRRLTIAQILAHPWFTAPRNAPVSKLETPAESRSASPALVAAPPVLAAQPVSTSSDVSDATYHSASSDFTPSTPSTPPDEAHISVVQKDEHAALSRVASDSTLKVATLNLEKHAQTMGKLQEDVVHEPPFVESTPIRPSLSRETTHSHYSAKDPPALPTRTPVRTKRRSVSSTLSDPSSPAVEKEIAHTHPQDFSSLLSTPAPLIFSTPLERDLLNNLSGLGFDTGQIVHSVLTDACDATGALWWMLKRRAEQRVLEDGVPSVTVTESRSSNTAEPESSRKGHDKDAHHDKESKSRSLGHGSREDRSPRGSIPPVLVSAQSAPELHLIPATPTVSGKRPSTPPRALSLTNPLLSPTSTSTLDSGAKSHPSTPSGSVKEKDKEGSKGRKGRSGSVSIMQRATTALEAAGLVKKKSAETVRDDKNSSKRTDSGEEARSSHASSSKLTKSPPLKPVEPHTPPSSIDVQPVAAHVGSPWLLTSAKSSPPPTPANSPPGSVGGLPTIKENSSGKIPGNRNRASLLTTFRAWFKEDMKGKRKEPPPPLAPQSLVFHSQGPGSPGTSPVHGRGRGTVKQRSIGRPKVTVGRKAANRAKRGSMSSRRSSSVNSKRSSMNSTQLGLFDPHAFQDPMPPVTRQRSDPSRRSFGAQTPNSESRPSSVHSFNMHGRHRKSPSTSSAGSWYHGRTSSPLPKNHRRAGSGSSTKVVRTSSQGTPYKQSHLRSNSTSSVHSLASSRQGSLYELSESEGLRVGTPTRYYPRSPLDDTPRRNGPATFVAQKRQTPFSNPHGNTSSYLHSLGRSSWKKSWGMEPPGWQTRTAQAPTIEVLAISPATGSAGIRDVFTGRQSLSMGDESDWVDEDDDAAGYVGGLGQLSSLPSSTSSSFSPITELPLVSPPLRGHTTRPAPVSRRNSGGSGSAPSGRSGRSKTNPRSSAGRTSPLPSESFDVPPEPRGGRRQLPNSRAGNAFRLAITEEEEEEEEA